jgi:hypothetical protein
MKLWQRSITLCIMLVGETLWAVSSDYIGDYSLVFIMLALLIAFIRAMFKPKKEKVFYEL